MTPSIELDVPADLLIPASGSGPGIVLFQEIFGVTDYIRSRAQDLVDLGYVVLVPHFYGRLGDPVVEEGGDGLPQAMGLLEELDWDGAVADGVAALSALRDHPAVTGGVGLLGFCFGGGLAFNVAAVADSKPDALVSYYGSALPSLLGLAPEVTTPSLHHFGDSDDYIPVDTVREIEQAVTGANDDVTFVVHPGAGHAFDNPSPMFHHEGASQEAWAKTVAWLGAKLPTA
ncbi:MULTISPECIES: dienelactone hydrolase family protein [unclassified Knoellia]|uniref:dienelactone hydrolase family protein n=1 Tax=Knoellia altitudinis TaxID=3404795 RepID=UPI00361748C8